jgi:predicted RecA/RadA family phage recombinase
MTTKYKARGVVMDYLAGAAIVSGQVLVLGTLNKIGVALADIANGSTGSVQVAGVFELKKKSADTFAQGAIMYWDSVTNGGELTSTSAGNTIAGYAWKAYGAGTLLAEVCINGATA